MILCSESIKERIYDENIVEGYNDMEEQLQPASFDLRLDDYYISFYENDTVEYIGKHRDEYILEPDEFVLASTVEFVNVPDDLVARVEGRSSYARLGLQVHVTAGYIDPGFSGTITLELKNLNSKPIRLCRGQRICQVVFEVLDKPTGLLYNGVYQHQSLPKVSKYSRLEGE